MSATPAVSVLVAAYNADAYLRVALDGLLAQSFRDFEVVVVDDANMESTRILVEALGDARLCYVSNSTRLGAAGAHWRAIQVARGRYLAVLNQDDIWRADFLSTLVPPLEADPEVAVAFSDHDIIDSDAKLLVSDTLAAAELYKRSRLSEGIHSGLADLFLDQTLPMSVAAVFRSSLVPEAAGRLLVDSGPAYDLCLGLLVARGGAKAYYSPQRLARYRVHRESQTSLRQPEWAYGAALCWSEFAKGEQNKEYRSRALGKAAESYLNAALEYLRRGNPEQARRCISLGLRERFSGKAIAALLLTYAPRRLRGRVLGIRRDS